MPANKKKTNILLITTDQHRLSGVGCYGDTPCRTPNLDRLAGEGYRFETAYTTCPVCTPARASIITGQHTHAHGMTANTCEFGSMMHELVDRPGLLSRKLGAAGYRLGYNGKYHLSSHRTEICGVPNKPSEPADIGFNDVGVGTNDRYFKDPGYEAYLKARNSSMKWIPTPWTRPLPQGYSKVANPEEETYPYYLTEKALEFLAAYRDIDQPFFMWHSFVGPHYPYIVPEADYEAYRDVAIPEWPSFVWDQWH